MVYCSGQVAIHPETKAMVEGGISDRTVSYMREKSHNRMLQPRSDYLHTGSMLQEPLGRT